MNQNGRSPIASLFVLVAALVLGVVPATVAADQPGWIVQFGTTVRDAGQAVAVDGRDVYFAGVTAGTLADQPAGGVDVFVQRYSSRGALQWTRQFGSSEGDNVPAGALDARRSLVVVGGSVTRALPEQTWTGGEDAFLRAYDRDGSALWTLQFGSSQNDEVRGIAIAKDRSIFVVGVTAGQLTDQPGAGLDAFVMRLDPDGGIRWLRQFGTSGTDTGFGIAVTRDAVYVTGSTDSAFPGYVNAGAFDLYVARFTLDGELEWVTQFGTSGSDAAWKIGVTRRTIFVSGHTSGVFAGETTAGDWDGFVAALGTDGDFRWARQFGTPGCDQMFGLAVDREGAVVGGQIGGVTAPVGGLCQVNPDASARKYDADGNLLWEIQFGTPAIENVQGVALQRRAVYLAGVTRGDLGAPNAGVQDAFLVRLQPVDEHDEDANDAEEDGDDD